MLYAAPCIIYFTLQDCVLTFLCKINKPVDYSIKLILLYFHKKMLWLIVEILSGLKKSLLSLHVLLSVDNVDSLVGNFIETNTLKVVDCIVALLIIGANELCS